MSSNGSAPAAPEQSTALLQEILSSLNSLRLEQTQLSTAVETINGRVNALAGVKQSREGIAHDASYPSPKIGPSSPKLIPRSQQSRESRGSIDGYGRDLNGTSPSLLSSSPRRPSVSSKIILTSYPGQAGVDPLPMEWGERDPLKRGRMYISSCRERWSVLLIILSCRCLP